MSEEGNEYDSAWNELRRRQRGFFRPITLLVCIIVALGGLNLIVGVSPWLGILILPPAVIASALLVVGGFDFSHGVARDADNDSTLC